MAFILRTVCVVFLAMFVAAMPKAAQAQATFSMSFSPDTIGPGGTSVLTYTIGNSFGAGGISDIAFTNALPSGLTVAPAGNATNTCGDGIFSAPNNGSTISFSGGRLPASTTCTLSVVVTASTPAIYVNNTGFLTSDTAPAGPASDDLNVVATLPGFSKSAAPNPTNLNDPFTVTYTIDNTPNASGISTLSLSETFPSGITVAPISNLSTTCGNAALPPSLNAAPGGNTLSLFANGFNPTFSALAAGASCTITVDLVADSFGDFTLLSGNLLAGGISAGSSSALVVVRAPSTSGPTLTKRFDPGTSGPGGTVQLIFDIVNASRDDATNIAFTDDLDAFLTGAVSTSGTVSGCGGTLSGTDNLTFTGGSLPSGGTCSFAVNVDIPGTATAATYTNTTSVLTATVGGLGFAGATATDTLEIGAGTPLDLDISLSPNPVPAGDTTVLTYTIRNPNPSVGATDIVFEQIFSGFGAGLSATVTPTNGSCGAGSVLTFTNGFNPSSPCNPCDGIPARFNLSGGVLPAGGMCTFDVTLSVPGDLPGGSYPLQTTAVMSDAGTGSAGSTSLTVNGGINLGFSKSFTSGPVNAGGVATLEYVIDNTNSTTAVTGLDFTDDLATGVSPALAGLVVNGVISNGCGGTPGITGGATGFTYDDGTLAGGATCRIEIGVFVPAGPFTGDYSSTSSALTGDAGVGDDPAVATLSVLGTDDRPVILSQEFIGGPFLPGEVATLRFTIENPNPSNVATSISFTESLSAALSGLTATGTLPTNPCGAGSLITGTTFLIFVGGTLTATDTCTFDLSVQIPGGAASGLYNVVTSNPTATVNGDTPVGDPASAPLIIETALLEITKEFLDDPVVAGNIVQMEVTVTNPTGSEATNVTYSDDLSAMLPGAVLNGTPSIAGTCGGIAGTTTLSLSPTTLAAGAFCRITFPIEIPASAASGDYANTISNVSGVINSAIVTGGVATDTVVVTAADAPTFSKAFSAAAVTASQTVDLTFTIGNTSTGAVSGLGFTDDLDAMLTGAVATGLPISACGGTLSGTSFLTFSNGSLAGSGSCTFTATVQIPASAAAGSYTNTTSDLSVNGLDVTLPATAGLSVEPAPAFAKAFAPTTVLQGETSTLTFTIDNSASVLAASALDFTDNLPAGMVVATPASASSTCTGGTLTAVSGTAVASYSSGSVGAGATCTVQVDVLATDAGALTNTSGDLTSSAGNSGTASATLTSAATADLSVSVADSPDPVFPTDTLTYTVELSNAGPSTALGSVSTLTLPAGVTLVSTTGCAEDPAGVPTCTLGDIVSGGSASYTVTTTVDASTTGTLNASATASTTTADPNAGNDAGTASTTVQPRADISVTKDDGLTSVRAGDTLIYTIVASNAGPSDDPSVNLTDTLPADLSCTYTSVAAGGATGNSAAGSGDLTETLSMPAGSSVTYTSSCVVAAGATGTLSNTTTATASVTDPVPANNSATDNDTAVVEPVLTFTKAFGPVAINQGQTSTLSFTIDNSANALIADNLNFTDPLPAGMEVAAVPNISSDCGGTFNPGAGDTSIGLTGGSVAIGATCTIDVDVRATGSGALNNTTSDLTSTLPTAAPASATLTVTPAGAPGFAKAFAPMAIEQGETSTLTFTIDNNANSIEATNLIFTDALPAGMEVAAIPNVVSDCGGTFDAVAAGTTIGLNGGIVADGTTCSIAVDIVTTGQGALLNTSSPLMSSLPDAGPAIATLTVNPAMAPAFTKLFAPDTIEQGQISRLTFTVDNSGNSILADNLSFTDIFPGGMEVAAVPNVVSDCGGTFTATANDTSVSLASGTVAALTICTVAVDVRGLAPGSLTNTSSDLTSTLPTAGGAVATLTVNAATAPGFAKVFAPDTIDQGLTTTLTLTIDNSANSIQATGLSFVDAFPAGMEVATPLVSSNSCGGTLTAAASDTTISLRDGVVAAGDSCEIDVDVRAIAAGTLTNTTSQLTSSLATAVAATADLTVTAAVAPGFAKVFAPNVVDQGETSTLTFTIDNSVNSIEAANLVFTDTFPAGMEVAATPNVVSDCGGTFDAVAAGTTIGLSGGTVAAASSCTIDVDVRALGAGALVNTSSDLTSSLATASAATATLTVNAAIAPVFVKAFTPANINQGETSILSFTIDNSANSIEAANLAFSDSFPAGMQLAAAPAVTNSCGGSVSASAGDSSMSFSGGRVDAAASCVIEVTVQGLTAGSLLNTSSALTSTLPAATAASATLTVNALPLNASLSFAPGTIEQFLTSTLTYTFTNLSGINATNLVLSDALPSGVVLASPANASTTCRGGILTAADGSALVSYTGGSVAASASCTVSVDVTSDVVGSYPNSTDTISSSLGTSAPASATLTVDPSSTGTITIVQNTDSDGPFEFTSTASELNFTINTAGGTGQFGPVPVVAGSYLVSQLAPDGVGTSTISCTDADSSGNARAGSLTINIAALEAVTCTFTSVSSRQKTVDTINRFLTKRADLILSSEPSNSRRIDRLKRGAGNSSALRFSNGDLQSFLPFTAQISTASETYSMSTSMLQVRQAAASLALGHGDSDGVRYVPNYRWDAWLEAQYKTFDSGPDTGHFAIAYFGVDYLVNPDLLIGALIQIDDMADRSSSLNSSVSGTGWMAGPYMTARLAPNLYFDGRIAAGTSTNDIRPFNTYEDEFSTDRWMAMAGLTGDFQRGDWTIQPGASLSYFEEKQHAYVDGVGVTIPSQVVSLGQVKIGPTFTGQFQTPDGMNYSPFFSLDAIYNFGDTQGVITTNPDTASTDGWRGRIQTGIDFNLQNGTQISLGGSYDGIGRGSLDIWGFTFELNIPIQKARAK